MTHPWKFCFWDPYHHFLKTSHNAAERLCKNLGLLAETTALPKNEPGPQKDGWSCGLQVISKVEVLMREWRKEGPTLLVPIEEVAERLNEYLRKLRKDLATFEEALQVGLRCTRCKPTKKGSKGCKYCMGHWFKDVRERHATLETKSLKELAVREAEDDL